MTTKEDLDKKYNGKSALNPDDLEKFFVERVNSGDIEGLVALYEPGALLVIDQNGRSVIGTGAIRDFFTQLLADKPHFEPGERRPSLINGDIALTSARLADGSVTAEVARKQPDGTWLWVIDQPVIAKENK